MSRAARQKTGVILALVALALGISAGAAYGWANEETDTNNQGHEENNHGNKNKGGKHKGERPEQNVPPATPETPQTPATPTPATPAAPVTPQGTPTPQQPTTPESTPTPSGGGENESPESPVVAQQTPTAAPLAPVAERKELAQTGLNPGLIALLGAMCLGGGAFFLRRALARG
jgi:LPXTG-motif cell wall-anchored protein